MKIYFVASIRGRKEFLENYQKIVTTMSKFGHRVTENTLSPTVKHVYSLNDEEKVKYYRNVLKWISNSDIVVAETSYPSIGVGFEISLALEKGKPVVVLHEDKNTPHFLEGVESDKLIVSHYNQETLVSVLQSSLDYASGFQDIRFNFFISPEIGNYLDWISKQKKLPRAVYLRKLIEEDMNRNKEFE